MICKAECASPGTGLRSAAGMMLDKSVKQEVLEKELTFKTHTQGTCEIFLLMWHLGWGQMTAAEQWAVWDAWSALPVAMGQPGQAGLGTC